MSTSNIKATKRKNEHNPQTTKSKAQQANLQNKPNQVNGNTTKVNPTNQSTKTKATIEVDPNNKAKHQS